MLVLIITLKPQDWTVRFSALIEKFSPLPRRNLLKMNSLLGEDGEECSLDCQEFLQIVVLGYILLIVEEIEIIFLHHNTEVVVT